MREKASDYTTNIGYYIRMMECRELGKKKMEVSQIRNLANMKDYKMEDAERILKVTRAYIEKVWSLINEHPEMNDEEIAELLMYEN